MLLALHIRSDTLAPAETPPGMRVFMNAIPAIRALHPDRRHRHLGGAFQRRHVLLIMSLAMRFISPAASLALVRAPISAAINPVSKAHTATTATTGSRSQSHQPAGWRAAGGAVPARSPKSCRRGSPTSPG
jgi:hypothetical protein